MGLPKAPKQIIPKTLPKAPDEPETLDPDDVVLGTDEQGLASSLLGKRALSRPLGVSGVGGV